MIRKSLPIVIFGLIVILAVAAIEFLPETLYFPVVEYTTPENVHVVMLKNGEPDKSGCEKSAGKLVSAIRANCPNCKYVGRCSRGLDDAQKKILSKEPLSVPSLRMQRGNLIMTISAEDPRLALSVCKVAEQQTASQAAETRLTCFPATSSGH